MLKSGMTSAASNQRGQTRLNILSKSIVSGPIDFALKVGLPNMEKELAQYIAKVAFRAGADLTDLIPLLKEHCDDDEFSIYARAPGVGVAQIVSYDMANY